MTTCGEVRYAIIRRRDEWRSAMVQKCTVWSDEGSQQCSSWADKGSQQCSSWADEGSSHCCDWWPCSWACDAFYWVAKWVCKGWYWVANLVCQAWYWLAKWVCRVFAWFVYWILTIVSYVVWYVIWIPCHVFGSSDGPAGRIKHVFVLVLENRSFDHMLGASTAVSTDVEPWLLGIGVDAAGMATTIEGPQGQTNSHDGGVYPVHAGADFVMPIDPPHEFCDIQRQLASTPISGKPLDDKCVYSGTYPSLTMAGFVDNYASQAQADGNSVALSQLRAVMGCCTANQVPVISTLAAEFAVCDHWFSALPGPTWPNRFFLQAATSGGLDRSPTTAEIALSELDGYQFENGTIYDALDSKEFEWRVYHGDLTPVVASLAGMDLITMASHYHGLEHLAEDLRDSDFNAAYVFIEPNYGHVITQGANFQCGNSQHPLDDITRGEALIKYVYEAIRQSPHWTSSVLLVTYDEHGGFYDHVEPPKAVPPGDITDPDNNEHGFRFDQLGARVPAVVVSPWIRNSRPDGLENQNCNLIDHTQYDHGSLLATIERLYGLDPLTSRDAQAKDFLHLLSASAPRSDAPWTLPEPAESGFSCGDDPPVEVDGTTASVPTPLDGGSASSERLPLTATMRGFVRVAAIQDAHLHPADRQAIVERTRGLRTVGDAREYFGEITAALEAFTKLQRSGELTPSPAPG